MHNRHTSGQVQQAAYVNVTRGGILTGRLHLCQEEKAQVEMDSYADVKMSLTGSFYPDAAHAHEKNQWPDPVLDRLAPVMVLNGKEYPLGEYIITKMEFVHRETATHSSGLPCPAFIHIDAMDCTILAQRSILEESIFFPAGTLYTDAIRELLVQSGITAYLIEPCADVMQTDREDWCAGESRLGVINDLLREISYHSLWCGLDAIVRAVPRRAGGEQSTPDLHYTSNAHSLILAGAVTRRESYHHPNVFHVTVENPAMPAPLSTCVENDNPVSPYCVQKCGRVPLFVQLPNIASMAALQRYAGALRYAWLAAAETTEFETGPNPLHSAFNLVTLNCSHSIGIYEEVAWRLPLVNGVMWHKAKRMVY